MMEEHAIPPAGGADPAPRAALMVLALVLASSILDRQVMAVVQEQVKADLALSDTQVGLLSGLAFALFYAAAGLPIARLADRWHRPRIIAASTAAWSVMTAACGVATGFVSLALARIGVAVGEAGASPPIYSLVSDYAPPERRGGAMSVVQLGLPLGVLLAFVGGGVITQNFGWRWA